MSITAAQIDELKAFFLAATIPNSIKLDNASTQNNVAEHVTEKINMLEAGTLSEVVAQTFYEKLQQIKNAMSKTAATT